MIYDAISSERQLLSSLRHDPSDVQKSLAEGLTHVDFTVEVHRLIFTTICELSAKGDPVDESSLWPAVGHAIPFQDLSALISSEGSSLHRRRLTECVISEGKRRRVQSALGKAQAGLLNPAETWAETWELVEPHLHTAQQSATGTAQRTRAEVMAEAKTLLGPTDLTGMPGPFASWDRAARKLREGELCVIAGRPGSGKSALALQYATACVKTGRAALIFSLEMSEPELLARLAVQLARSTMESQAVAELERLATKPYEIVAGYAANTLAQIEGRAKMAAAKGTLGLIIIDYLQLITPPSDTRNANREQQVATMSRRCKLLAGETRCPVILLAQLNRESEKEDRRPRISDLRESGAIEQDADAVWLLHREKPEDTSATVAVQLIQAKRRNWQPGIFQRLGFTGEIVTFSPLQTQ